MRMAIVLTKPLQVRFSGSAMSLPVGRVVAIAEWPTEIAQLAAGPALETDTARAIPAGELKVGDTMASFADRPRLEPATHTLPHKLP